MKQEKKEIKVIIDGRECIARDGMTILEVAREHGIDIPTLCYLKEINEIGACRMCIVEIEGVRGYKPACTEKIYDGMVVKTSTEDLIKTRKNTLELILSNHNKKCLTCIRNTNCELQNMAKKYSIDTLRYEGDMTPHIVDDSSLCITRDTSKCILCGRCVNICGKVQTVHAITKVGRGFNTMIGVANDHSIAESTCVGCGQCVVNCPVGALKEKDYISEVISALNNKDLHVVVQTAPAVRAALGEEFGLPIGTLVTKKMVAGLKALGFDKVFDTDVAADLTIMEEGTEFLDRVQNGGKLPMITSCSSGWITFAEKFFPDVLDHLSTAKSPMEMLGTIIKTKYAEDNKIDPNKIFSVAIMPCSAKKAEIVREELKVNGMQMVDVVLTTRELARMLKTHNIDITRLENAEFDSPLGHATGAGHLFGTTGGVMEAALRTVVKLVDNKEGDKLVFKELRGLKGIRESVVEINGKTIKVAVADGLANVRYLMEKIQDGTNEYDFIEVMTCPGGCIMGGGQPIVSYDKISRDKVKILRACALYEADENAKVRRSHENKDIQKLYKDYFGKPNESKAHELLHTTYHKQEVYKRLDEIKN